MKGHRIFSVLMLVAVTVPGLAAAAEGGEGAVGWERAFTNLGNQASIQRGAKLFMSYCSGCHEAKYMRYVRLSEDIGLTQDQVQQNLMFAGDKIYDPMTNAMRASDQTTWLGKDVPDLSLVARSRGVDWIYSYLESFYVDPSRPLGWNNAIFDKAAMPNPLWELQGIQVPVYETVENEQGMKEKHLVGLKMASPGKLSPEEFDRTVRDITTFLEYVGEPAKIKRQSMGIWVLLFVVIFTLLAWLLKHEYWKDVH